MMKLNKIKAILLIMIIGIMVLGCKNANNSSSKEKTTNKSEKVYVSFAVDGMTCSGDEKTIQTALTNIQGVDSAFASHVEKQVKIFGDTGKVSIEEIKEVVNLIGYSAGEVVK